MDKVTNSKKKRITSPSITIYKPELVTMMSIMGRATGVILSVGVLVWVLLVKLNPLFMSSYGYYFIAYEIFKGDIFGIIINSVVLFILIGFYYHLLFAIRNIIWFIWEDKLEMDLESIHKVGYSLIGASIVVALINWLYIIH